MNKITREEACKFADAITKMDGKEVDESFKKEVVEPYLRGEINEDDMEKIVLERLKKRVHSK